MHFSRVLLATLGISALTATPALAAPHDDFGTGTAVGTNTTASPVSLCALATNADCFFGVFNTAAGAATASVTTTANGQVVQALTPRATASTLYDAQRYWRHCRSRRDAIGTTAANALVSQGIVQAALAGEANLNFDNNGVLLVDAVAIATGGAATANANATVNTAILQTALATTANLNFTNDATITVLASASATATNSANAFASVNGGINRSRSLRLPTLPFKTMV